ncbi:unnamed protein product [Rotaria sp. Silwood1]|nr:unnamed protein product [Rotaria sp. Silwood1]CAF1352917.1 unnamed protein product [Rotaria sp. Silwood1]CAF1355375.1 unnamed protein product [Rotaria sp. Silwood1]CAF3549965.1 unnamed protein product [Rotaria sp. Silwood1]CAF3574337.1 unnamed protein product [Rotaria sp. Silwood1]
MFNSSNESYYKYIVRCLSIYALILVIVGTLGNLFTIVILCRRNLRRYVTMRYLIAVSICDIVSLYGWNLNNFYKFTISSNFTNIEDLSIVHCRIISYMTFVGLQLSSWCLTAVSLDRCLSLYFLTWKQNYGKLSRTKYYIAALTIICLLFNSHILFLNGYVVNSNVDTVKCYARRNNPNYIYPQWERAHLIAYNLCPFFIMCLCNTYIIYITIRSARIRTSVTKRNPRHRQLSIMLILVTFVFVVLTLPSCIYYVFFRHQMSSIQQTRMLRYMIQICLGSIQFTAHAINFFLYCFSTKNFRNELHDFIEEIFLCLIKPKTLTTTTVVINSTSKNTNKKYSGRKYGMNQETTLENQQTGQQYALKDMQTIFINNE